MSWTQTWLGYLFGRGVAKAVFNEPRQADTRPPIRQQTEEEIRADERRYAEDEKRLDAEDEARRKHGAG